jgi:hypothetical protein
VRTSASLDEEGRGGGEVIVRELLSMQCRLRCLKSLSVRRKIGGNVVTETSNF